MKTIQNYFASVSISTLFIIGVVGIDDSCHQFVANDVLLRQVHNTDALYTTQDVQSLYETAFLRLRQVYL